jgi:hypothetical protein
MRIRIRIYKPTKSAMQSGLTDDNRHADSSGNQRISYIPIRKASDDQGTQPNHLMESPS